MNQVLPVAGRMAVDSSMRCIASDGSNLDTYEENLGILDNHIQALNTLGMLLIKNRLNVQNRFEAP